MQKNTKMDTNINVQAQYSRTPGPIHCLILFCTKVIEQKNTTNASQVRPSKITQAPISRSLLKTQVPAMQPASLCSGKSLRWPGHFFVTFAGHFLSLTFLLLLLDICSLWLLLLAESLALFLFSWIYMTFMIHYKGKFLFPRTPYSQKIMCCCVLHDM